MNRLNATPARTAVVMTTLLAQITLRVATLNKIPVTESSTWIDSFQAAVRDRSNGESCALTWPLQLLTLTFATVVVWVFIIWLTNTRFKRFAWEPAATHAWEPDCPWWVGKCRQREGVYDDLMARRKSELEEHGLLTTMESNPVAGVDLEMQNHVLGVEMVVISAKGEQCDSQNDSDSSETVDEDRYLESVALNAKLQKDITERKRVFEYIQDGPAVHVAMWVGEI